MAAVEPVADRFGHGVGLVPHDRVPEYPAVLLQGGRDPPGQADPTALLEGYRAAAQTLAELARASAIRAQAAEIITEPVKPAVDEMWAALRPLLEQVAVVERAWNALAQLGAG